ncbi:MAG: hypothetical protein HWN65_00600 [Candidatus Helarchaeota archaeon]|nr:hypothetical protein [Candidatus Helarchaeota archaeon]
MSLRNDGALLRINESLDIPRMSKFVFWIALGSGLVIIGLLPLLFVMFPIIQPLFTPEYLAFPVCWLGLWLLAALGLFHSICYPKTKIIEGGLMIGGTSYRWEEFSAFKIQRERSWTSYATVTKNFLFLYLKSNTEPMKIDLGKRNPTIIQNFLQEKITPVK